MEELLIFDPTVHVDGVSVEDMLQEVKSQFIARGYSSGDSGFHRDFFLFNEIRKHDRHASADHQNAASY